VCAFTRTILGGSSTVRQADLAGRQAQARRTITYDRAASGPTEAARSPGPAQTPQTSARPSPTRAVAPYQDHGSRVSRVHENHPRPSRPSPPPNVDASPSIRRDPRQVRVRSGSPGADHVIGLVGNLPKLNRRPLLIERRALPNRRAITARSNPSRYGPARSGKESGEIG